MNNLQFNFKKNNLITALVIIIIALVGFNLYSLSTKPKLAFVKNTELFAEFKGKQELEAKFTASGTEQQSMLDTLTMEIAALTNKLTEAPENQKLLEQKREKERLFMELKNRFLKNNDLQQQQYTESIWKQINQYVLEYGEKHQYDYVFGALGNGSLMYASNAKDITEDVLKYINKKYEGL